MTGTSLSADEFKCMEIVLFSPSVIFTESGPRSLIVTPIYKSMHVTSNHFYSLHLQDIIPSLAGISMLVVPLTESRELLVIAVRLKNSASSAISSSTASMFMHTLLVWGPMISVELPKILASPSSVIEKKSMIQNSKKKINKDNFATPFLRQSLYTYLTVHKPI